MLDDEGSRLVGEILQDVGGIIDVGQVRLAGVLSGLEHLLFVKGGNEAVLRGAPLQAVQVQAAFDQLVECCRLIRIFSVAQAFLFPAYFPLALLIDQRLVSHSDGHRLRIGFLHDFLVHVLELGHVGPPDCRLAAGMLLVRQAVCYAAASCLRHCSTGCKCS